MAKLFRRLNLFFFVCLFLIIILFLLSNFAYSQRKAVEIFFFYSQSCPYCQQEKLFLENLKTKYPLLLVREYEVSANKDNAAVFSLMAQAYDKKVEGTPTLFIGQEMIVGYNQSISQEIERKIDYCFQTGCPSPGERLSNFLKNFNSNSLSPEEMSENFKFKLNLIIGWFLLSLIVFFFIFGLIKIVKKS